MKQDLADRLFDFSVNVLSLLKTLPNNAEVRVIRYQLIKSSTSTGANYEEAQAGSSKADFTNKVRIALKEMRETNYWLRLLKKTEHPLKTDNIDSLIIESEELKNILGAIVQKCRKT
jgi:four helix bundle protein